MAMDKLRGIFSVVCQLQKSMQLWQVEHWALLTLYNNQEMAPDCEKKTQNNSIWKAGSLNLWQAYQNYDKLIKTGTTQWETSGREKQDISDLSWDTQAWNSNCKGLKLKRPREETYLWFHKNTKQGLQREAESFIMPNNLVVYTNRSRDKECSRRSTKQTQGSSTVDSSLLNLESPACINLESSVVPVR